MKKGLIGVVTAVAALLLAFAGFAPGAGAEGKGGSSSSGPTSQQRGAAAPSSDDDSAADAKGDSDNKHPSGRDRHEDKGTQGRSTSDPDSDGKGMDRTSGCNVGQDKPYSSTSASQDGTGGCDQADQDGNNGCGNDDDFEDDNNGWCGKPKTKARTTGGKNGGGTTGGTTGGSTGNSHGSSGGGNGGTTGTVAGTTNTSVGGATATPEVTGGVAEIPTSVLGVTVERPAPAAAVLGTTTARPTELPAQAAAAAQAQRPTEVLGVTLSRGASGLARTGITVSVLALLGLGLVVAGGGLRRFGRRQEA